MTSRSRRPGRRGGEALAADIHDALRSLGWVVPRTEDEVRLAERELADAPPPELPEALQDARGVFERRTAGEDARRRTLPFPGRRDVDATLARAAREGGNIPPEVEQAMRRDRQAAERDDENGRRDRTT